MASIAKKQKEQFWQFKSIKKIKIGKKKKRLNYKKEDHLYLLPPQKFIYL